MDVSLQSLYYRRFCLQVIFAADAPGFVESVFNRLRLRVTSAKLGNRMYYSLRIVLRWAVFSTDRYPHLVVKTSKKIRLFSPFLCVTDTVGSFPLNWLNHPMKFSTSSKIITFTMAYTWQTEPSSFAFTFGFLFCITSSFYFAFTY